MNLGFLKEFRSMKIYESSDGSTACVRLIELGSFPFEVCLVIMLLMVWLRCWG